MGWGECFLPMEHAEDGEGEGHVMYHHQSLLSITLVLSMNGLLGSS